MIPDKTSKTVEIFINNHLVSIIRVMEFSGQGLYNLH
ncbi:hypothetical protein QE429_000568 [Bacillus sp. SORGH_AS 510]|nr:hypothetical protein [Bacillus sp. SORGH_AS_0510]